MSGGSLQILEAAYSHLSNLFVSEVPALSGDTRREGHKTGDQVERWSHREHVTSS